MPVPYRSSSYAPSRASRRFGLGASLCLYAFVGLALLIASWRPPNAGLTTKSSELTVIDLAPPAPAPAPPPPTASPPKAQLVVPAKTTASPPVAPTLTTAGAIATPPSSQPALANAASSPPAPTPAREAPSTLAAAPEQPTGKKSWEGEVLARLYQFRRYPTSSRQRGEQGVPRIRFVVDRTGHVLSCTLETGSGHAALDREAVSLPMRAQPLPPPPPDHTGSTITLVVPVEFTLS